MRRMTRRSWRAQPPRQCDEASGAQARRGGTIDVHVQQLGSLAAGEVISHIGLRWAPCGDHDYEGHAVPRVNPATPV